MQHLFPSLFVCALRQSRILLRSEGFISNRDAGIRSMSPLLHRLLYQFLELRRRFFLDLGNVWNRR